MPTASVRHLTAAAAAAALFHFIAQLAQHHLQRSNTFRDSSRTPDLREHKWAAAADVDLGSDSNDE